MNIVGISGSLRMDSTNSKLLLAASQLTSNRLHLSVTDLVGKLPLFSPDIAANTVIAVDEWSSLIRTSDGIIISTPEYARGYPGALKNAFDWLVQGDAFVNKPFMFLKASERANLSHSSLTTVIETMSGVHIAEADGLIPLLGTKLSIDEILGTTQFSRAIQRSLETFETGIKRHKEAVHD